MDQQTQVNEPKYVPPKHVREAIEELVHKEATWAVNPRSLFVAVIIVVLVTAGLMVAGLYIGRDLAAKSRSETRTIDLDLTARLERLTRTVSMLSKQPQQVTLEVPKEALKMEIALPQAPPPQPLHIHTKEVKEIVVKKTTAEKAEPKKTTKVKKATKVKRADAPAPGKKAEKNPVERDVDPPKQYRGMLPPPQDTPAYEQWIKARGKDKEK